MTVPELMEKAADFLAGQIGAERSLVLFEGRGKARGIDPETIWAFGEVSQELLRDVLSKGEPVLLLDALQDPRYGDRNSVILSSLRSIMCVPLRTTSGRVAGLLYADNRVRAGAFKQADLDRVSSYASELLPSLLAGGERETADIEELLEVQWL